MVHRVLHYQPPLDGHKFCIGLQNAAMLKDLKKYGHNRPVLVDATYSVNNAKVSTATRHGARVVGIECAPKVCAMVVPLTALCYSVHNNAACTGV